MIHIYSKQQAGVGEWEIWSDPDEEEKLGRIIGIGPTKEMAVLDAIDDLKSEIRELERELPE